MHKKILPSIGLASLFLSGAALAGLEVSSKAILDSVGSELNSMKPFLITGVWVLGICIGCYQAFVKAHIIPAFVMGIAVPGIATAILMKVHF